jgi:TonB family protein
MKLSERKSSWRGDELKRLEIGAIIALSLLTFAFYTVPDFAGKAVFLPVPIDDPVITYVPMPPDEKKVEKPPIRPDKIILPDELADEFEVVDEDIDNTEIEVEIEQISEQLQQSVPEIVEETLEGWQVDKNPEILKRVEPVFPKMAKLIGESGQVVVEIVIGRDGEMKSVKIQKGHPSFNDAALKAVRQWRFSAGVKNGAPVQVKMIVPIRFVLK